MKLDGKRRAILLLACSLLFACTHPVQEQPPKKTVRLLTIGNSFTQNTITYLPDMAKAGNNRLILLNCVVGGYTLEQHAQALVAAQKNPASPAANIYTTAESQSLTTPPASPFNLITALKAEPWDFVTLQQQSFLSSRPESYEPFAGEIIQAIRENCPKAEILVFETWAFRADDPLFSKGNFSAEEMHARIKSAYEKIAATYHLRVIPVGDAFHSANEVMLWHFVPDTKFDFAHAQEPALPDQWGSLNAGWQWQPGTSGKRVLSLDAHHANAAGAYLSGATFYEILFAENVENIHYSPSSLPTEDAASLRHIAHATIEAEKLAHPQ